ncbi:glycosyltransferase family 2 protein [Corallibacter vietnamensis]|uniref:Glycosyltransferase family 2 protein n=1 Tax=Corallibacter vietnamensis TaxID=904130 RepID=A0ABP7HGH6_9FLAO
MSLKALLPTYSNKEETDYDYVFTIFTPVYNRAETLHRVFDSLKAQTFKNFELVLINDGSKDNSHQVASDLIKTADFPVNYINNTKNRHKMACFIQAIQEARGQFILPFDSDDACTPDALETFYNAYKSIPENKKEKISGVTCLCKDQNGNLVGKPFKTQPYYSNTFIKQLEHLEATEKWGFTKTSVLKRICVNDDIFSKGYIPEGIIWELIAKQGFETKYINDVLRIYYLDSENAISIQNHEKDAYGMAIYSLSIMNWFYKDYISKYPKLFLKRVFTLLRAAHFLDFNFSDYWKAIDSKRLKTLFLLGWPFKSLLKNT